MNYIQSMGLLLLTVTIGTISCSQKDENTSDNKNKYEDGIYAEFTTSKGKIVIRLESEKTPMTVANFVGLAEGNFKYKDSLSFDKPFYNGLKFHRVISDFMIQGGDPQGNGQGSPGYKFFDETREDLKHDRSGILSMANSGPSTNGSQFFITHKETPWLDGRHTVFGHVIEGQDVVDAIQQDDVMETVKIIRVGKAAKKFKATEVFNNEYNKYYEEWKKENADIERIASMSTQEYNKYMYDEILKEFPQAKQSTSGLVYVIEAPGSGLSIVANSPVSIHYVGTLRKDGSKFDSSRDRGAPMPFTYQVQRMIPGFEEGIGMLKKGGKAKLFIPYHQAYGPNGQGPIPAYSDLIFDIEVMDVQAPGSGHDHHDHDHSDPNHRH